MYYRRSIDLAAFSDVIYDKELALVLSRAHTTKLATLDVTGCRRITNSSLGMLLSVDVYPALFIVLGLRMFLLAEVICLNNLRELNLSRCDQLTVWTNLRALTILEKLVVADCDGLDDAGLAHVVRSVPTIKALDVSGCFKITHRVRISPTKTGLA